MMEPRWDFAFALALIFSASSLSAQNSLTVRAESESRTPLTGALIALVTPSNQVIEERLSNSAGSVTFNAAAGEYRVRVRRIGFSPYYSPPVTLPRSDALLLRVESPRVVLQQMVVSASAQCGRINPDAATLSALWEEITKGLRASQLTANDLKDIVRRVSYQRHVREDGSVISSDSTVSVLFSARPFLAQDPALLVTSGYVRGNETIGWTYFAPDEKVLLSDAFASTHCFRAVRDKKRPNQIGVAFRPIPKRKLSDITGVVWLDQRTSELRDVEFQYVNAGVLDDFRPGGFSRFLRMPSGAMIVSEWQVRMPRLTRDTKAASEYKLSAIVQTGGRVYTKDETPEVTGTSVVRGSVFDSLAMRPLSNAVVSIGTRTVRTDGRGHFVLSGVPSGSRVLSFTHGSLAPIGMISIETPVEVQGDTATVSLAVPSRRSVWTRICGAPPDSTDADNKGILYGTVRDEGGRPVDEASVTMHFKDFRPKAGPTSTTSDLDLRVTTDADGSYAACGFKSGAVGTMKATHGRGVSGTVEFSFEASLFQRKDLTIPAQPSR